jgi:hypothetical protein
VAEPWGAVELEPEVADWLFSLGPAAWRRALFHIELLESLGPTLGEPDTRQLKGKLRELRFFVGGDARRVTYFVASHRRIILLTTFRKTAAREERQVERAMRAMDRCILEGHSAEDEDD